MKKNKKILILNTGGTFNKTYNQISGKLLVTNSNKAILNIFKYSKIDSIHVDGLIFKDSLDINKEDRNTLKDFINNSKYSQIIIVHGTDTMDITAKYLSKNTKNKTIVITGSMIPFSIDPIESTSNLMLAIGFLQNKVKNDIFIAMHGQVKRYTKIKKNRTIGKFECQ